MLTLGVAELATAGPPRHLRIAYVRLGRACVLQVGSSAARQVLVWEAAEVGAAGDFGRWSPHWPADCPQSGVGGRAAREWVGRTDWVRSCSGRSACPSRARPGPRPRGTPDRTPSGWSPAARWALTTWGLNPVRGAPNEPSIGERRDTSCDSEADVVYLVGGVATAPH